MFLLRKFSENDINEVIFSAGGKRAHLNEASRKHIGADYILGNTLIELKLLQEEGLNKKTDKPN